jgi:pimeloyl-ACP methyl ester carboxylesterase
MLPVGDTLTAQAPRFFGPYYLAGEVARCAAWPSTDTPVIRNVAHELKTPAVLIGNDFDPATPLSWTRRLAHALGMERNVVRYQGGGHGAYLTKGNTCIDTAIEPYLFDLRLPPEGTICAAPLLEFSASTAAR